MRCPIETPEGAELVLAYLARRLDAQRAATFEQHLAGCPGCGELVAAQAAVGRALDAWEAPSISPDFNRRLYRRIEEEVSWWDLLMRPFRPAGSRAVPVAAAAMLLIAAGLWIERPGSVPQVAVPQSAEVTALPQDQAEHALQEMEMMQEFSRLVRGDASDPRM